VILWDYAAMGWQQLTSSLNSDAERSFLRSWILANVVGLGVASAINGALVNAVETRFDGVRSAVTAAYILASTEAIGFGLVGAVMGVAQFIALRRTTVSSGWWVVATGAGWVAAGIVSGTLAGLFGGALTGVGPDFGFIGVVIVFVGGFAFALPGVSQYLVLRRSVPGSRRWVATHILSFLSASLIGFLLMIVVGTVMGWEFPSAAAWGFEGVLAGIVYGFMTGIALTQILRQPAGEPREAVR
jgi:hypothetical protein